VGLAALAPDGRRAGNYERHRPETTTLYAVVRDNVETLYAAVAAGFAGAALPPFVRRELEGYLDCGLLCRGFARLKCGSCGEQHLVAFACKGRGICPSCPRPQDVPDCPESNRARAATGAAQAVGVHAAAPTSRATSLRRPAARCGHAAVRRLHSRLVQRHLRTSTRELAQSGAVVAVQRASSDLKLNPHLHAVFLDGVYVPAADPDSAPEFRPLPRLSTTDVADALQVARARILRYLEQRRVITLDSDADSDMLAVSEELAERDPALSQLAAAAVCGLAPAGPELRRKPREICFSGRPGVVIDSPLSVREAGFSRHAATRAGPADDQGREALLKYILPPAAGHRAPPPRPRWPRAHRPQEAVQ
jgi:hypothetical protein